MTSNPTQSHPCHGHPHLPPSPISILGHSRIPFSPGIPPHPHKHHFPLPARGRALIDSCQSRPCRGGSIPGAAGAGNVFVREQRGAAPAGALRAALIELRAHEPQLSPGGDRGPAPEGPRAAGPGRGGTGTARSGWGSEGSPEPFPAIPSHSLSFPAIPRAIPSHSQSHFQSFPAISRAIPSHSQRHSQSFSTVSGHSQSNFQSFPVVPSHFQPFPVIPGAFRSHSQPFPVIPRVISSRSQSFPAIPRAIPSHS